MEKDKVYVGIDISKDGLDVAIHASDKCWHFSNDHTGINKLRKMLVKLQPALAIFEATVKVSFLKTLIIRLQDRVNHLSDNLLLR